MNPALLRAVRLGDWGQARVLLLPAAAVKEALRVVVKC